MIKTTFLTNEGNNFKEFKLIKPEYYSKNKFNNFKNKFINDVFTSNLNFNLFHIERGEIFLKQTNQIYCLDFIPYSSDIILPKHIQLNDWIILYYEQTTSATCVSNDKITKIKIHGNGHRIMGFDEPLLCDMPFMTLRMTFLGDIDGWVVT